MTAIAHVGHGYWGRNLARNFHALGHLAVVVEPDAKAAHRRSRDGADALPWWSPRPRHGVVDASFHEAETRLHRRQGDGGSQGQLAADGSEGPAVLRVLDTAERALADNLGPTARKREAA